MIHKPVLVNSVLESFSSVDDGIIIDCTIGFGGMSKAIMSHKPKIDIIGIDRDLEAVVYNRRSNKIKTLHGRFSEKFPLLLSQYGNSVVGVLADIGVSSYQLDNIQRGFSFKSDRLDMRMDSSQSLDAEYILNKYSKESLEKIFREYGEIRCYKKLVNSIIEVRKHHNINGSIMSELCRKVCRDKHKHPCTQVYQAIRIEVNDELGELKKLLDECENIKNEAVLSVIAFHSLEDRIIKSKFREWTKDCVCPPDYDKCVCGGDRSIGYCLNKKPISPSKEEVFLNPRSRSAKLRSFKFYPKSIGKSIGDGFRMGV